MHLDAVHRLYMDRAVAATRINLQAKIDGKMVMIKAKPQRQLDNVKESIGDSLQIMKGQIDEVQKSQEKMWGGISQMGEELQGLIAKQNASDFEHEGEETAPKYSPVETSAPCKMVSPIPLIGMPSPSVHVDAMSVGDSVSSACQGSQHPHRLTLKLGSVMHNYLLGR